MGFVTVDVALGHQVEVVLLRLSPVTFLPPALLHPVLLGRKALWPTFTYRMGRSAASPEGQRV